MPVREERRAPGALLTVERGLDLSTAPRSAEGVSLVLPLRRSAVVLRVGALQERIDRSRFAVVPARTRYRLKGATLAPEVLTVALLAPAWERAQREYGPYVTPEGIAAVCAAPRLFARTRWVDEIAHRYLFERDVCGKHGSEAAAFLETELAKEVYFLGKEQLEGQDRASLARAEGDVARRALEWIDARLFEPFQMADLARHCRTSESTLLRAFRRETGAAPAAYVRERRLQEAHLLLGAGRGTVGEVAQKVGYTNLSAFTSAFGRRFGVPPSDVKAQVAPSELLPPHGQPPRKPGPRAKRAPR